MKIVGFETFLIEPRWVFLRVDTDEGISGWGEPIVEGRAETVAACVSELFDYLTGKDPLRIEEHWQLLTKGGFYRGGPILSSAVAGIDQALWDIAGKVRGVPVHELLGGPVRERVRIYGWLQGDTPEELADSARAQVQAGLTAVKMTPSAKLEPLGTSGIDHILDRVSAVREAVGPHIDLGLDFHGRTSISMARRVLPLLEPLRPLFAEEPVTPEFSRDLARVVDCTTIPIATGERLFSRWDFRDVFPTGIAVAQPDVSHAGGISEVRRIAAMAEAYDCHVAPHCPLGPITFAASLQIDFAIPNFLIQEQALGLDYHPSSLLFRYLVDPSTFTTEDGYLDRPLGPGLGIEIDERAVREAAQKGHRWRNPIWRHDDGSLASW